MRLPKMALCLAGALSLCMAATDGMAQALGSGYSQDSVWVPGVPAINGAAAPSAGLNGYGSTPTPVTPAPTYTGEWAYQYDGGPPFGKGNGFGWFKYDKVCYGGNCDPAVGASLVGFCIADGYRMFAFAEFGGAACPARLL